MKDLHVDNLDEIAKWLVEQGEAERAQMIYAAATYFEQRIRDADWDRKERRRMEDKIYDFKEQIKQVEAI